KKADLISTVENKVLHSGQGGEYPFPSIIKLVYFINIPFKKIPITRRNIFKRDAHTCHYCGTTTGEMTLHHLIPKSRGGEDSWQNLITACLRCNNIKGDMTPDEAGMKLLRKPVRPNHVTFLKQLMPNENKDWDMYLFNN